MMGEVAIPADTFVPAAFIWEAPPELYAQHGTFTKFRFTGIVADTQRQVTNNSTSDVAKSFRPVQSPILIALDRLRKFKLWSANWDGEGAPAPDCDALDSATKILSLIGQLGFSPSVALNVDGQAMLMINERGIEGEVTVLSSGEIEYYIHGADGTGDIVAFDGSALPAELVNALPHLMQAA